MERQSTADPARPSTTGYVTRPGVVTFICMTALVSIALQGILLGFLAAGQYRQGGLEFLVTVAIIAVALGLPSVIVFGLWRAKNWARIGFVIVFSLLAVLELLAAPNIISIVRIPLLVALSILLSRPKSSAYFKGEAVPPIDPGTGLEISTREIVRCPS